MTKPIGPQDIVRKVPDVIIEVFNELIQEKYNGKGCMIFVDEVLERLAHRGVFQDAILGDIYHIYRAAGCDVTYQTIGHKGFFQFYPQTEVMYEW